MDNNLMHFFEKARYRAKGTRLQRVLKNPTGICRYKMLQLAGRYFNVSGIIKVQTFWGEVMHVFTPEPVSLLIYRDCYYEEGLTTMFLQHLKPGMTFCDIGAHFGYFSLLASRIVGNAGQVHSFEPTSSTFEVLKSNTQGKSNIHVNNLAVFSKEITLSFNNYGLKYSAFNSISRARCDMEDIKLRNINVKAVTLDGYVENHGIKPEFVKIDAESAEYDILRGMRNMMRGQHRPIITLEVGDLGVAGAHSSKECTAFIMEQGYDSYEFKDGKILPHEIKEKYDYDNLLFIPSLSP